MNDVLRVIDRLGSVGRLVVGGIAIATIARGLLPRDLARAPRATCRPSRTSRRGRRARCRRRSPRAKIPSKLGRHQRLGARAVGQVDEARVAVDKAGLAVNGEHEGYQLLDSLGMSSTDFQQNVAMKRALEGELANQIQNIVGVSDATVNLAMPQQTLFLADQKPPTASVLLTLSGAGFDDAGGPRRPAPRRRTPSRASRPRTSSSPTRPATS